MSFQGPEHLHTCTHTGCRETSTIRIPRTPVWKCARHESPDEHLSTTNRSTSAVWEVYQEWTKGNAFGPPRPVRRYWGPSGKGRGMEGTVRGPGFEADAQEWPPGTRLIVTTRVVLPEDAPTLTDALGILGREWSEDERRLGADWLRPLRRTFDNAARLVAATTPASRDIALVAGDLRAYATSTGAAPDRQVAAALVADALEAQASKATT